MKYSNKSNKSFTNIKNEMEIKALKYALSTAPLLTGDNFRMHKKFYMERYFKAFPEEKQKYDQAKTRYKKLSVLIAIGALTAVTLGGVTIKEANNNDKYSPIVTTEDTSLDNVVKTKEQEFKDKYAVDVSNVIQISEEDQLKQEVKNLTTEDQINRHRKEIVAELYNKQYPNSQNPMTADRLGIIKKSLNYLYNRVDENGNVIAKVAESQKRDGDVYENEYLKYGYEFYIDDKLVEYCHQNGDNIITADIGENQEEFFKNVVQLVHTSETLKDAINRKETVVDQVKQKYIDNILSVREQFTQNKEDQQNVQGR